MESLFTISTEQGGFYFSLFYFLAFFCAASIFIYDGFRRKYQRDTWLLVLSSATLFFILGNKLLTYSSDDWRYILENLNLPPARGKTILGGIAGVLFGLGLAKYWFRIRHSVLDSMAIAFPVMMAIQRVGCLMAGCCFGKPTNLPWGIEYGIHSYAYQSHMEQGLIQLGDITSLPVHPTQLYDILFCLSIAFVIYLTRKRWTVPGNRFLFTILLYAIGRFLYEFLRDPRSNLFYGEVFHGLKYLQWILLAIILILASVMFIRKRIYRSVHKTDIYRDNKIRILLFFILFIFVFWLGRNWFDNMEYLTLLIILILVFFIVAWQWYRSLTLAELRWVPLAAFLVYFVFVGQKVEQKTKKEKSSYTTIGVDTRFGRFDNVVEINEFISSGDCGYYSLIGAEFYKHSYFMGGPGISHTIRRGEFKQFQMGIRTFYGNITEPIPEIETGSHTIYGIEPYIQFNNWKYFGFGMSITYGNFGYSWKRENIPHGWWVDIVRSGELYRIKLCPQGNISFGPRLFNLVYRFAQNGAISPFSFKHHVGIGTNFNLKTDLAVEGGIALGKRESTFMGFYIYALIPVKQRFEIIGNFTAGKPKFFYNNVYNYEPIWEYTIGLGFHYRFNFKP
ncbi:MAG: prolipoprotein diacylglyceryl transferase [Bacteroidetes bacterium]|nr:prolipoprotein diacylglyceryl transferase [Bacteroidota bacterium]